MQKSELGRFLLSCTVIALAILVVAKGGLVSGISCDNGLTLVAVVVIISLLNYFLRPLLLLVAMPLVIASFGLLLLPALWVANATVLYLVGHTFGISGFHVETFGAALWGSLWISIISFFISRVIGGGRPNRPTPPRPGKRKDDDPDVIDV